MSSEGGNGEPIGERAELEERATFKPAEHFLAAATAVFEQERASILKLVPAADVRHIGGTSAPGALTKGDLDIQARVERELFREAVSRLNQLYKPRLRNVWSDELATFTEPTPSLPGDIGISVVVEGSRYDRNGSYVWSRLASEPDLLAAYNAIKTAHAGGEWSQYEEAKGGFFASLLNDQPS